MTKNTPEPVQTDPPPPSGKHRSLALILTICLLAALFLWGFLPRYYNENKLEASASKEAIPKVRVLVANENTKKDELILPSSLDAIRITPLWARTNGYLAQFFVDIGDPVQQGQLLAIIETPEVDQQLDQARADLVSANARNEIARTSTERWQALFEHNPEAISKQEVDERQATFLSSKADVVAAEANVRRLEELQGFKYIFAPFNGTIIERDIDIGSLITAGNTTPQQLFKIAKTDVLRAFVSVPQFYYRSIQDGMQANVTVREFQNREFAGVVVRNARALDPTARTLLTEVHIDNKEGILLAGLYAEVHFKLHSETQRFNVPIEAIIVRTGPPEIAVVKEDGTIQLKTVKIGRDSGSSMEIIDGIQVDDRVVINPNERILEGVRVEIVPTENTVKN